MKYPKIKFSFSLKKDAFNLYHRLITKSPLPRHNLFQEILNYCRGKPTERKVFAWTKTFWHTKDQKIISLAIEDNQEVWDKIYAPIFFKRLEEKMQCSFDYPLKFITAYLSISPYSGYYFEKGFFFVNIQKGSFGGCTTVMHELMHYLFHKYWQIYCLKNGLPKNKIWEVKESLTVILNDIFQDKIICEDKGYDQHKNLRNFILKKWKGKDKNFKKMIDEVIKNEALLVF